MAMSKKDYTAIANIVGGAARTGKEHNESVDDVINMIIMGLADYFGADNERFLKDKFIDAINIKELYNEN